MPSITSAGVGSGLDVNALVSQLVAAERAPVANRLARQESSIRVELSAFGKFRSALSGIDTALQSLLNSTNLDGRSVSVQDESVFTASVNSGAPIGSFDIQVEQLAQAHRLASTVPLSPPDADVGYGTLSLQLGTDAFSVDIGSVSQSLADVRDAINDAADNPGVVATIINVDGGAVLQLSSDRMGTDSQIQLSTSGGDGGLNTLVSNLGQTQGFQDAIVFVNGNQVTSSSNTLDGVIEGVSVNLKDARPGEAFNLTIERDSQSAKSLLKAFVESYNGYVSQADSLGGFNSTTGNGGALNGDSVLRSVSSQLRVALTASYGAGSLNQLTELGISFDVEGKLSLDESVLDDALASNFTGVQSFLSGDNGFAASLQSMTERYIQDDGVIDSRLDSLNGRLDRLEDRNSALNDRMARVEARYLAQFSALDIMLSRMQQTSSYLGAQLANLPGVANQNKS